MLRFPHLILFCMVLGAPGPAARAAGDSPDPIRATDPRLGEILFYFYQGDYVPAIVRLQAARQRGQLDDQLTQAELLLGDMLLSAGHHREAANVFEHLQADDMDRETRDRAWFSLAKDWYRGGYLDSAQEALHHMSESLPADLSREARMVQAEIYIDSGQYDRAVALLQAWGDNTELKSYARYNLSVALLRDGQVGAAMQSFDALGRIEPANEELSALRDKANLALGYALLREGQPQAARTALQRVRPEGPFSNKALLGVGWAEARLGSYEHAIVPWTKLRDRDLPDPAVLESMLAVPYALARLGSMTQAADGYRNAIDVFDEETNRIDRAIGYIESDESFERFLENGRPDSTGAYWLFEASPKVREARYALETLATDEFQEGLRDYRDLARLDDDLETWQHDIDVYASVLDSRKKFFARMLPRMRETLAEADLNDIAYRQQRFAALLDSIEKLNDWLALANEDEFDTWRKVSGALTSPALAAGTPEAEQARYKIRMLKGILQWELERKAEERLHRAVGDLRQVGEVLTEAEQARDRIEHDMRTLPVLFAELGEQIDGLAQRIGAMRLRVADTQGSQRAFLQSIAVGELVAQKDRLRTYTLQARLALATIYEQPASSGGGAD